MGDFATRKADASQKIKDAADDAERNEAIAELLKIQEEEIAQTQSQGQAQVTELKAKLQAEERARTDAQADLNREINRSRGLQAIIEDRTRSRRTVMDLSGISGSGDTGVGGTSRTSAGTPSANPAASTSAANSGLAAAPSGGSRGQNGNNPAEQRTLGERLLNDPERDVYRELERVNNTSFLNSIDSQSTIITQRPDMFQEPTPDHIYDITHRITNAPVTDNSIREDLKQEKNMIQKIITSYPKFSGNPAKGTSWEMFEIQMKGLVSQGVFRERELSVILWGLIEGDARLYLMSKGVIQGSDYTKMFQQLQKAYKRKPAAILQDMAQCTQGSSESVLSFTARFRIISAGTFPDVPAQYRIVDGTVVRNPLSQAEALQYKVLLAQATLQAQHHYVKGLRQDIRRRMRKLRFLTLDEAETEATEAEEELQDLGDLKDHPNPLVKPQINMLKGQKGNGQHSQGQTKKFEGECYACHKYGHRANECKSRPNNNNNNKNNWKHQSRSQQDENAHVQGAINAVKGQLNHRSPSRESKSGNRGRSASPRGKSPHRSGSSASRQGRQGRGSSRNRDRVSFSHHQRSGSGGKHGSGGKYKKQKGKFNALHGEARDEEEDYDSASGNE